MNKSITGKLLQEGIDNPAIARQEQQDRRFAQWLQKIGRKLEKAKR